MHTVRRTMIRSFIPKQRRWILNTNNDKTFAQKAQFESLSPELINELIDEKIKKSIIEMNQANNISEAHTKHQFTRLIPNLIDEKIKNSINEMKQANDISEAHTNHKMIKEISFYLFCGLFIFLWFK